MKTFLSGHTSFETAKKVEDYPYGFRLRTTMFYWIETVAKKGDRFVSQTINPKNGRLNAPKKSTFVNIGALYLDEKEHVKFTGVTIYTKPEEVTEFVTNIGGEAVLLPEQLKQLKQLRGEKVVAKDAITGDDLKDFKVKWEKDNEGKCDEAKITFDRPDGVSVKEIFNALKSLNQDRLKEVFTERESKFLGKHSGIVRICVRGGYQLTTVSAEAYNEWKASDAENVKG